MPNYISTNNTELEYYKTICHIQDKFIKGEISREEMEQKLETERQNQIIYLTEEIEKLKRNMNIEYWTNKLISVVSADKKQYRYKKTGEVYNGQIYINGECCTDGRGNEIIYQ